MKKHMLTSIRLTLVLMVLLCVLYPLTIALAGHFSAGNGSGEKIRKNGNVVGYARIGQRFTDPKYFWGRPSAVDYNAAGSGGSNKGPSNTDYLQVLSDRIDTLKKYNPGLTPADIPADIVTASASGLDPDISEQAAIIQIKRIAIHRNLEESKVAALVTRYTKGPLFGLFSPSTINVLKLNLALDELQK